ncbi:unnamed protein product [Ranitomeya imitator]|uniref:Ras-related protein Rab-34 n=1 Tax=Ranitomeya imitator TaxID=111125 RepID=A0ABN9M6S9_9NEOB|nr:unnamed protein product [Ranitomeya imitator]
MSVLPPVRRDRIVAELPQFCIFPRCFKKEACLHTRDSFHSKVIGACKQQRTGTVGFKISKVIVVGDLSVGKTCMINRWDTAGQERFKCIASTYYRGAQAIVISFDLTDISSLEHTKQWLQDALRENDPSSVLLFLVGSKKDLTTPSQYALIERDALKVAKEMQAEYWSVSSLTGENVKEFFFRVASLTFETSVLAELEKTNARRIGDVVRINSNDNNLYQSTKKTKSKCCERPSSQQLSNKDNSCTAGTKQPGQNTGEKSFCSLCVNKAQSAAVLWNLSVARHLFHGALHVRRGIHNKNKYNNLEQYKSQLFSCVLSAYGLYCFHNCFHSCFKCSVCLPPLIPYLLQVSCLLSTFTASIPDSGVLSACCLYCLHTQFSGPGCLRPPLLPYLIQVSCLPSASTVSKPDSDVLSACGLHCFHICFRCPVCLLPPLLPYLIQVSCLLSTSTASIPDLSVLSAFRLHCIHTCFTCPVCLPLPLLPYLIQVSCLPAVSTASIPDSGVLSAFRPHCFHICFSCTVCLLPPLLPPARCPVCHPTSTASIPESGVLSACSLHCFHP